MMDRMQETLTWKISVPIFRSAEILKQLGFALGIPLGLVIFAITLTSGYSVYTIYALGLMAALLFFTWLLLMVVYGGKYEVEFMLDDKGVFCRTQPKQAKRNRVINTLAVVLGLLSGKPAVMGAGILAQSRQEVFIRWNRISKVKYKPHRRTVLLWGGWTEHIALFCTEENYTVIEQAVILQTKHLSKN